MRTVVSPTLGDERVTSRRRLLREGYRRWAVGVVLCALAGILATGCAKARAQTVPDGPPLATPAPPPRVLAPVEDEEPLAASPPPQETPTASAPRVPARQTPPRRQPTATAEADRPPEAATPAPQPPPTAALEPPRELRPASSPTDAEAERKVRDVLAQAARNLNGVDYKRLTAEGKDQYDQAKRFADQTDEALKARNLLLAETLADKAAKLASQLLGR